MKYGDLLPADGIVLQSNDLKVGVLLEFVVIVKGYRLPNTYICCQRVNV